MRWMLMLVGPLLGVSCGTSDNGGSAGDSPADDSAADDSMEDSATDDSASDDSASDDSASDDSASDDSASDDSASDDGAVPDGPAGAISLEILSGCSATAGVYNFPSGATRPVDATAIHAMLADGDSTDDGTTVEVTCQWLPDEPHKVTFGFKYGRFDTPTLAGVFFTANTGATDAVVGVSATTPEMPYGVGSSGDSGCVVQLLDFDEQTKSAWGEFTCDHITSFAEYDECGVGPSYFYFENCGN